MAHPSPPPMIDYICMMVDDDYATVDSILLLEYTCRDTLIEQSAQL